ncbi:MAG TPA: hypothetical protein VMW72_23190 [Sedimentisphaerales bacterium]|nr:hypothetical protein [Sedimentisphaerales bacterium]
MIRYIVHSVNSQLKLERHYPHCNRSGGNIHSGIRHRAVSDIKITAIAQRRMKCPFCGTTWTIRAKGIDHGRQRSDRVWCVVTLIVARACIGRLTSCYNILRGHGRRLALMGVIELTMLLSGL